MESRVLAASFGDPESARKELCCLDRASFSGNRTPPAHPCNPVLPGIQTTPRGGTEFIFPAAQNPRIAAILTVLLVFWTAWMAVFIKSIGSAWAIFPSIILGVIDAFLLLFALL